MTTFLEHAAAELQSIREQGLFKAERTIDSPQQTDIRLQDQREVLNLCANNYLGLANHPEIIRARPRSTRSLGLRNVVGSLYLWHPDDSQDAGAKAESFLGTDDTILYGSCFDANGGLFETLLSDQDAIISDQLRKQLRQNTEYFRSAMTENGFNILPSEHPIAPVVIGDASLATRMADAILEEGIYVVGFSFPVVPKGEARI